MRHHYSLRRMYVQLFGAIAALVLILSMPAIVSAACADPNQQSCSGGWGVSETYFGSGGQLCVPGSSGNSTSYCAKSSVGELTVGDTLGTAYQAQAGFNTNREPTLAVLVNDSECTSVYPSSSGTSFNLGTLTTGSVSHVTANFSVLSYLASGYAVQISGQAPTNNDGALSHTFTTLSNAAPSAGTEGFGMNLRANSGFGHDVSQLPDSTFGFGAPSTGYNTANQYSYANSAQIATSAKSSGVTCYFPSFVYAISNLTPGGTYTFNATIVVTPTF